MDSIHRLFASTRYAKHDPPPSSCIGFNNAICQRWRVIFFSNAWNPRENLQLEPCPDQEPGGVGSHVVMTMIPGNAFFNSATHFLLTPLQP